ncbi:MAG: sulfatase-like hydrolase/transferase [Verrucomicrobiota bacterium]
MLEVVGHPADYVINTDLGASISHGSGSHRVGHNAGGRNSVYIFELPALNAGETLVSAEMRGYLIQVVGSVTFNGDLWGIGFSSTGSPTSIPEGLTSDGPDPDGTNVKIEDDLLTPASVANSLFWTSEDQALKDYIQTFYTANPSYTGGEYVYLRINHDGAPGTNNSYNLASASNAEVFWHPRLFLSTTEVSVPKVGLNFVFVITDDQRWDIMGLVQDELDADPTATARFPFYDTPNMDALAASGTRFRNAFVVCSICSPSRAAMLTGIYNHRNGIIDNYTHFPATAETYATLLQGAGYHTGYVGKWHMETQPDRPGFAFQATYNGQGSYFNQAFTVSGGTSQAGGRWIDDRSTDYAESFIRRNQTRSFCMVVGYKAPHEPWIPATRNASLYSAETFPPPENLNYPPYTPNENGPFAGEIKEYLRCVYGADENLGRILDTLDETGLDDETVVIYVGDNGYLLRDHRRRDKRAAYEESLRIPMLIRCPGEGVVQVRDEVVLNIDLAPTILELAGVSIPAGMQGRSLAPILMGQTPAWREGFLYEYFREQIFNVTPTIMAYRKPDEKLITYPGRPEWTEWYDLSTDRYEKTNLSGGTGVVSDGELAMFREMEQVAREVGLLPRPTLHTNGGNSDLDVPGVYGPVLSVRRSTDLVNWTEVTQFQADGTDKSFVIPGPISAPEFWGVTINETPVPP